MAGLDVSGSTWARPAAPGARPEEGEGSITGDVVNTASRIQSVVPGQRGGGLRADLPRPVRRLRDEGFFVLESVLSAEDLDVLRGECVRFIDERDREMDRLGVETLDLDHRGSRYFLHAYGASPAVRRFLFSELMAEVAQTALGDTVYLFNEQYVVKAAERGMKFGWHQDSGFIPYSHRPDLTFWVAHDDVTEANGTVYLLPYARAGTRKVVQHVRDEETNDLVGYFGDDPGDPVIVTAGSVACFSSTLFHRSGANTTDRMRRVYLAQYSAEPIL
ncbi:MAG: phytanoyl-CoA dioxygenase family protein, partial [Gaiellales bacterium]